MLACVTLHSHIQDNTENDPENNVFAFSDAKACDCHDIKDHSQNDAEDDAEDDTEDDTEDDWIALPHAETGGRIHAENDTQDDT